MRRLAPLLICLALAGPASATVAVKKLVTNVQHTKTTLKFETSGHENVRVLNRLVEYAAKNNLDVRSWRNVLTGTTTVTFEGASGPRHQGILDALEGRDSSATP